MFVFLSVHIELLGLCFCVSFTNCLLFVASGPGRCKINNGGCWHESRGGEEYSACLVSDVSFRVLLESAILNKVRSLA